MIYNSVVRVLPYSDGMDDLNESSDYTQQLYVLFCHLFQRTTNGLCSGRFWYHFEMWGVSSLVFTTECKLSFFFLLLMIGT
jgi:hypothetical protein